MSASRYDMQNLKDATTHFAFGENWSRYLECVDETRISEAEKGLLRLIQVDELKGKSLLDIGCGSGLHSLAALRLGARLVVAIDIDQTSVSTTQKLLDRFAGGANYTVQTQSVFDIQTAPSDNFDIVYSWGVLHHTGAMREAIAHAAKSVKPGGYFVFALYRKTMMCGVWKYIKRWYAHTSRGHQQTARAIYLTLLKLRYKLGGKDLEAYKENHVSSRGMSFDHDVHDWLGGYPYESILPQEVSQLMEHLNFSHIRSNIHPGGIGLFGSGCDEYVFVKTVA